MERRHLWAAALLLTLSCLTASAQKFFNLTAEEVRIDSVLPSFGYSQPLPANYQDSLYTVSIAYPEYIDMSAADIRNYQRLSADSLPAVPVLTQQVVLDRKRPSLEVSFCPLVYRNNRYQILVSFMLKVESRPLRRSLRRAAAATATSAADRYADHSVLASGRWAKIRVPSTGVYQLTDALIRQAGFTDLSHVKVYGYGGNLQSEVLRADDLTALDDLPEVPQYVADGRHLFYARGPVSWTANNTVRRTRNPYSDYGYYLITQTDDTPQTLSADEFLSSFYPSPNDYHTLYEVDSYSWYHGGRNLFDPHPIALGATRDFTVSGNPQATSGRLTVNVSAGTESKVEVLINEKSVGVLTITLGSYDKGGELSGTYTLSDLQDTYTVQLHVMEGGPVRLDYISVAWNQPYPAPDLASSALPVPEYVHNISNQDLHADGFSDMVIIIPTSQKLRAQAERLKAFHEQHDGFRVRLLPADELYNEFSSGTPDANAYRRYLKMLYDRATSEADLPRYLLLFGDCLWDNRLLTSECSQYQADDYLLCYESENSFNAVYCYVDDGFFCLLDDGEGGNPQSFDKLDMAVGRFPVTTETEAKTMVDKTIAYVTNKNAGPWQNTIMMMGDDGNNNLHMTDANTVADRLSALYPGYLIKKVMWDAYTRESSSTGNTYPEVSLIIKQQQAAGALIMDYAGHGRADQISHENVLRLTDFSSFTNTNLPLWITASCDIMPFDGVTPTIGEAAVLNSKGGAVAFYGTTRTVYADRNKAINQAYLTHVLSTQDGKPVTLGEANRLAKNELITTGADRTTNKLQYSLLGDPAIALCRPTLQLVVDAINDIPTSASTQPTLKAGSIATVEGHVEGADDFDGIIAATVRDSRELITCKLNEPGDATKAFTFYDRTKTLFQGNDSIRGGTFRFSFAVPKDINYSNASGLMNLYAVNTGHTLEANGSTDRFLIGGSDLAGNDSIGPSIYCYLNSPSFTNGGSVNPTPYFVAKISDEDGVNTSGSGIGHDLELIIDGKMERTYILNDNFQYDFGSYTSGSTFYNIPELEEGEHRLLFRAWDILNNSSTAQLTFRVVRGLEPTLFSVSCTENPASTSTSFIINHDRTGSDMDVELEVFDMSGRQLWRHQESGVSTTAAYTVDWDLTIDGGQRLQTGVYLYRVRIASDGSSKVSKARKLIVLER